MGMQMSGAYLLAIVGALLLVPRSGLCEDNKMTRGTLKAVKGVNVSLGIGVPSEVRDAIDSVAIRTDLELKLRQSGIRILSDSEWVNTPGLASLDVTIDAAGEERAGIEYAVHIKVEFSQYVNLVRMPKKFAIAPTWSDDSLWLLGRHRLSETRSIVSDLADRFLNAYLAANPKPSGPK